MAGGNKSTSCALSAAQGILYWALVLCIASFVFIFFLRTSGVNGQEPASINRLLAGTAAKPYVFRVLLPTLARSVSPVFNQEASLSFGIQAETMLGNRVFRRDLDGKRHPREVLVILAIMYTSLVGFAITIWHLLRDLGYPPMVRQGAPILLLLGSMLFMQFGYIYDFTTLFLFSLGCLLMQRQQWLAYLLVFACATLNKETAIFLCVIFELTHLGRIPRGKLILFLAWQVLIYALLQGAIRYAFRDSPGSFFLDGLPGQITALRELASHRLPVLLCSVIGLLIAAGLIASRWREKPVILRAGLVVLAFLLVLYLVGGYPSEIRVFLEVYPIVAILLLPPPRTAADSSTTLDSHPAPDSAPSR